MWQVLFCPEFRSEFAGLDDAVKIEIRALSGMLAEFGPSYGRPRIDTLKGSEFANMKEMRFAASDGIWRVAFAFDPKRRAVLLVAGDKSGGGERRFYKDLIRIADERYRRHLDSLEAE